jgi:predicted DNA-binding transcriptional regulator AlpA
MHGRINKFYREPLEAQGLRVEEAVLVSGIGRSVLFELIKNGSLPARKIGKKTIILRPDL